MLIFVRMMEGNEGGGRATLRLWFSFWIDVYKTKIIVCDTMRFAPIFKLVRDLMKGNLRFQIGKVFPSKKSELNLIKRVPDIYRAQLGELLCDE